MQVISFNSFKSYWIEIIKKLIWKIMKELIKIKRVNFKINYNFNIKFDYEIQVFLIHLMLF